MPAYEIILDQRIFGNPIQSSYTFNGDTLVDADVPLLCDGVAEAYVNHLSSRLTGQWAMTGFRWRNAVAPAGTPYSTYIPGGFPISGTGTGDALPPFVCALIKYSTGLVPPYRGRTYMSGLIASTLDENGFVGNATVLSIQAFYTDLADMSDFTSKPVDHVILSGPDASYPAGIPAPVLSTGVRNEMATQRGRMRV